MNLTSAQMTSVAIGLAACFAGFKFLKNAEAKTACVAVGAVIIANQIPYISEALQA